MVPDVPEIVLFVAPVKVIVTPAVVFISKVPLAVRLPVSDKVWVINALAPAVKLPVLLTVISPETVSPAATEP